eukprot:287110-Alexandrium_andersonii.AAC.1
MELIFEFEGECAENWGDSNGRLLQGEAFSPILVDGLMRYWATTLRRLARERGAPLRCAGYIDDLSLIHI